MNCGEVEHYAAALAVGALNAAEQEELERHMRGCPRCRSVVVRAADLVSETSSAEAAELSPQFWPRLCQRLQAHDAERAEGRRRRAAWRRRLRPVLASVSLLLAVWVGIHLGNAYALRKFLPTQEAPAFLAPEEPVFLTEGLEGLRRGSLSVLLLLDSGDVEAGRPER